MNILQKHFKREMRENKLSAVLASYLCLYYVTTTRAKTDKKVNINFLQAFASEREGKQQRN